MKRTYDNGSPFLTLFPDGTGCCYYPSGNVAVLVTSPKKNSYSYIVQTDEPYDDLFKDGGLLAFFEPNGESVCYYNNNYSEQRVHTFINTHGTFLKRTNRSWDFFRKCGRMSGK